jgi:hypothetical protein
MTRKDYELIAAAIKDASRYMNESQAAQVRHSFAVALKPTNPRFNVDRFLKAAGQPQ